jgi:hypothetical protein
MRFFACLAALVCLAPLAVAANKSDEVKERDRLEKAGARVTFDDGMPDAARLRVSFAKLDDKTAAALKGCTHVAALTVEDASKLTDKTLAVVGTFTGLRELSLFKPAITSAGLAHLKDLKELRKLYLVDARVYDSGVASLKGLENLEELDLSGAAITSAAGATFKELPALEMLAVSKTKFGDAGAAQLKELKHLKKVEALNTDLSVKAAMALEADIPGIRIKR